jgi:hypothetical protein
MASEWLGKDFDKTSEWNLGDLVTDNDSKDAEIGFHDEALSWDEGTQRLMSTGELSVVEMHDTSAYSPLGVDEDIDFSLDSLKDHGLLLPLNCSSSKGALPELHLVSTICTNTALPFTIALKQRSNGLPTQSSGRR